MKLSEIIKPISVYYHGSTLPDLTTLQPAYSELVDNEVVFAATLPEIAVAMATKWTDDDFYFGHSVSTKKELEFTPYNFREIKDGAFQKFFDQPVYVYMVSSETFQEHQKLQDFEVISYKPVKVHSVIKVEAALEYLESSPYINLTYK